MTQLCALWGIKKTRTTPFYAPSNGMVERSNRSVKQILRQVCQDKKDTWDSYLPYIRMVLNHTVHSSIGYPLYVLFMSQCTVGKLPCDLLYGPPNKTTFDDNCLAQYVYDQKVRIEYITELAFQTTKSKVMYRKASRNRGGLKIRRYKKGDLVFRLWKPSLRHKLASAPWSGPWKVLDVDPTDYTVRLRLPKAGGGFKNTWIHTSNLKPVNTTPDGKLI